MQALPWGVHSLDMEQCYIASLIVSMLDDVPSSLRLGLNLVLFLVTKLKTRSSHALECGNVSTRSAIRYGRARCWRTARCAYAHASTYVRMMRANMAKKKRKQREKSTAGHAIHVRLAYCLVPMHAWL